MKVDIKEKLKKGKMSRELSNDHRSVFEKKIQKELHSNSGENSSRVTFELVA